MTLDEVSRRATTEKEKDEINMPCATCYKMNEGTQKGQIIT